MANDFAAALADEIADLEAQLEADPRFAKLRELRRIQVMYAAPTLSTLANAVGGLIRAVGRSPSPERQAILESAAHQIRGRADPTPTSELFDLLTAQGVEIPGASPKNNLSAMLSNAKTMFKSHGRSGWTLIEGTPEASDDLLSGSASEAPMSSPASPAGEPSSVRPVDPVPGGGT